MVSTFRVLWCYGVVSNCFMHLSGIKSNLVDKEVRRREKEGKWVGNFQKHRFLADKEKDERLKLHRDNTILARDIQRQRDRQRPASAQPTPSSQTQQRRTSSQSPSRGHLRGIHYQNHQPNQDDDEFSIPSSVHHSKRSTNEALSRQELIMLGMYKLSSGQEEIYLKFIEMLKEFDEHDMVSVSQLH
jgi:hypothetical protein